MYNFLLLDTQTGNFAVSEDKVATASRAFVGFTDQNAKDEENEDDYYSSQCECHYSVFRLLVQSYDYLFIDVLSRPIVLSV